MKEYNPLRHNPVSSTPEVFGKLIKQMKEKTESAEEFLRSGGLHPYPEQEVKKNERRYPVGNISHLTEAVDKHLYDLNKCDPLLFPYTAKPLKQWDPTMPELTELGFKFRNGTHIFHNTIAENPYCGIEYDGLMNHAKWVLSFNDTKGLQLNITSASDLRTFIKTFITPK